MGKIRSYPVDCGREISAQRIWYLVQSFTSCGLSHSIMFPRLIWFTSVFISPYTRLSMMWPSACMYVCLPVCLYVVRPSFHPYFYLYLSVCTPEQNWTFHLGADNWASGNLRTYDKHKFQLLFQLSITYINSTYIILMKHHFHQFNTY